MDASQQVLIETLPPILVLHMKRFLYDTTANGVIKIGKQVSFGPDLETQPDIIAPARKASQSTKYKLFGGEYLENLYNHISQAHSYRKYYTTTAYQLPEGTTLSMCYTLAVISTPNSEKVGCTLTMNLFLM
jgi:hypothetical protein